MRAIGAGPGPETTTRPPPSSASARGDDLGVAASHRLLGIVHHDLHERGERRVAQRPAVAHLALEERFVVLRRGEPQHGMLGIEGLHDHASRSLPASGAARDLGQELERALGGAEIGQAERLVGRHDADERDAREIVTLGDHLRADEDVDLAALEAREDPLVLAAAAHGVAVHALDARRGRELAQHLLDLLGALPDRVQLVVRAARTPSSGTGCSKAQ